MSKTNKNESKETNILTDIYHSSSELYNKATYIDYSNKEPNDKGKPVVFKRVINGKDSLYELPFHSRQLCIKYNKQVEQLQTEISQQETPHETVASDGTVLYREVTSENELTKTRNKLNHAELQLRFWESMRVLHENIYINVFGSEFTEDDYRAIQIEILERVARNRGQRNGAVRYIQVPPKTA